MKRPAQRLSTGARIRPGPAPSLKARPSLGPARGSPRAAVAVRKWSDGGEEASWAAGGRFAAKCSPCLSQDDVLAVVAEGGTLNRQPRVGPDASGPGSKPGFLSQLCLDTSSLFVGLGGGQPPPTLWAPTLGDAGVGSRADGINPYPQCPFSKCPRSSPLRRAVTQCSSTACTSEH